MKYKACQPECEQGFILLALIHGKFRQKTAAIDAAQAAIKCSPDSYYPYYIDALVGYWFNENDAALTSLTEALRLNPTNADLYSLGASIYAATYCPYSSIEMAETGLRHDAENVGCLGQLGMTLFSLERKDEAEAIFRQLLTIDNEQPTAQGYIGYFEVCKGRYELALPLLRNTLRDQPQWELAQKAWREAIQGQYPVYGVIARTIHWIYESYKWQVFATTVFFCWLIIGVMFHQEMPDFWRGCIISFLYGALAAAFLLLILRALFIAYLRTISILMSRWNTDLRRHIKYNFEGSPPMQYIQIEKKSPYSHLMLVSSILMFIYLVAKFFSEKPK